MSSTSANTSESPRPKAVVFCPECGHEAPIRELVDREVWVGRRRRRLRCPDCRRLVLDRPVFDAGRPPATAPWSAWTRAVSALFRPWHPQL